MNIRVNLCRGMMMIILLLFIYNSVHPHADVSSLSHDLNIYAPLTATEGDCINITVTLNGLPVQARIILDGYHAGYTNASTGVITLKLPPVCSPGRWCTVNATYLNEYYATHQLYIKNKTRSLNMIITKACIIEFDEFTLTVISDDKPVEGARVIFNHEISLTDKNGRVVLTAPDVLVNTNYGIILNKTGYTTTTEMITIYDAGLGDQLMEVTAPLFINSDKELITVRVYDKYGGLPETDVYLLYKDEIYLHVKTDNDGVARLPLPVIDKNYNSLSLKVEKTGYKTYNDISSFQVYILDNNNTCNLRLNTDLDEVKSGSLLMLNVTDEYGNRIKDARIWRNDGTKVGCTDANGSASIVIPHVFFDRGLILYAIKTGCNLASKVIMVRSSGVYPTLNILVDNTTINEGTLFRIGIVDEYNNPVSYAVVTFNMLKRVTDTNGVVYFTAPDVDQDTFYTLSVSKEGYKPGCIFIMVINTTTRSNESRVLHVNVPSYVWAQKDFTVMIKDRNGYPIKDAMVSFHGISRVTDHQGLVSFRAPDVLLDTLLSIRIEKKGYEPTSITILIRATVDYPYEYIIPLVGIILMVGVIYYIRYNRG
ncbi:MAG: hypothetical protein QXS02_05080 [Candidatus Thermoplasmatota archaeon]